MRSRHLALLLPEHLQLPSDGSRRAERVARLPSLVRVASLRSPNRGDAAVDTQIASKGGFANNFWLQIAVAVLVTAIVVLIAVEVNSLW